ncbi:MAG: beta-eliminating lyase-related protein [Pseudomonadota bacterium]
MQFSSDNVTGAHPALIDALVQANGGAAMPYGNDPLTEGVEARIRTLFEAPRARVFLVATGTAANAIALASMCPPWGAIYCHGLAHIEEDECNAPEFFTGGAKLTHVDGPHATVAAERLAARLGGAGAGNVHNAQPGAVSITQATERGAVYTPDAVARLAEIAHARGLALHMDGTRFANAVAATGASPAALSHRSGVDVLCLGATKCAAMAAEAIVLFEPDAAPGRAWEIALRRKRGGHLLSKMRFVSAQMAAWLDDGLWLSLAAHANAMAARLRAGLASPAARAAGLRVVSPPDANLTFVTMPEPVHRALQAAGARYYAGPEGAEDSAADAPDPAAAVGAAPVAAPMAARGDTCGGTRVAARLVTSWATTEAEVDAFLATVAAAAPVPDPVTAPAAG